MRPRVAISSQESSVKAHVRDVYVPYYFLSRGSVIHVVGYLIYGVLGGGLYTMVETSGDIRYNDQDIMTNLNKFFF